jgi:hypothetical protein
LSLSIGHHALAGRVLLAPMAGVTDPPFRDLCTQFGAALACAKPLTLLWMLAILPSVPQGLDIRPSEVLDASRRSALLFWHRPFQYRGAFFAAQEAAPLALGDPPQVPPR